MGGVVDSFISLVARPLGIYTHDETFTDLQITPLLTAGAADEQMERTVKARSGGKAVNYMKGLHIARKEYKKTYSENFLKNTGFAPNSNATMKSYSKEAILSYLQTIDSTVTVVDFINETIMKDGEILQWYFSNHSIPSGQKYSNMTRTSENTIRINYVDMVYDKVAYFKQTLLNQGYTIEYTENFTMVYKTGLLTKLKPIDNPNNLIEKLDSNGVPIIYCEAYFNDAEGMSVTRPGSNTYFSSPLITEKVMYISTDNSSKIFVYDIDNLPLELDNTAYIKNIAMTALIPLKNMNTLEDLELRNTKRLLNKLNLSGDTLTQVLENPDLDSAYLLYGIDPQVNDPVLNRVVFKMFDLMDGSENFNMRFDQLSMRYSFNLTKDLVQGNIGAVGTYTKSIVNRPYTAFRQEGYSMSTEDGTIIYSGTNKTYDKYVMVLKYQISENSYRLIEVENFKQDYTVSGHSFSTDLQTTGGYLRLIIPIEIIRSLRYKDWVVVHEHSLCMLAFAIETVEVKWYETKAFANLIKIVAIVFMVLTLVSGTFITGFVAEMFATVVATAGLTTAASYTAVLILQTVFIALETLVISTAIDLVADFIGDKIGGEIGVLVKIGVQLFIANKLGMIESPLSSFDSFFISVGKSLSTFSQYYKTQVEQIVSEEAAFKEEMQNKIDELEEKNKEFEDKDNIQPFDTSLGMGFNSLFDPYTSIREFTNTDVSHLADYGFQIDYAVKVRSSVTI
jgi:hypothetical protein